MAGIFQINTRLHYGLILMTELAESSASDLFVSLQEITDRTGFVPQGYLEEIAASFRKAGLIEGKRGLKGGYKLRKSPDKISIQEIFVALEGPLIMVPCQDKTSASCPVAAECPSKEVWFALQERITQTLSSTSLADLVKT